MAWERRRIETSIVIVIVTLRDLTYVFSYKLSWTLIGVLWFVSQEVWLTKSWRFDTFWITCYNKLCYSDHSVLEIAMISLPMNWSTGWQLGIKCMPDKLRRRFLRFFCDFVRFFLKNQISHLRLRRGTRRRRGKHTGLEDLPLLCDILCQMVFLLDVVEKWKQTHWNLAGIRLSRHRAHVCMCGCACGCACACMRVPCAGACVRA